MSASRRDPRYTKSINLALQGGGSHGAFTWGVLDKLFEDDRIWIEAISGTSAGAMNAVVAAQGMYENGGEGARARLATFWKAVSDAARNSPIRRSVWAQLMGDWSLDDSPTYRMMMALKGFASPYDFNPLDLNPLRDIVREQVDFDHVRACSKMGIFVGATSVETGRARIFSRGEITLDAVMASACLPNLFKAVKIGDHHYWDGGFAGNPPLFPFFHGSPSSDIVIVQINPVVRPEEPRSAPEIENRINEITFNASLLNELRAIDFVRRLLDSGKLKPEEYKRMNMHIIHDRKRMRPLDASSKLNSEWEFLQLLFEIGRDAATRWLARNFDHIGVRSSVDIQQMFHGYGVLPDPA